MSLSQYSHTSAKNVPKGCSMRANHAPLAARVGGGARVGAYTIIDTVY
ncbi:MAG: hypothetical protein LUQ20_01825 [Candidatus Methanoperedens sp.]|nr:hypothetical protein [Candidatus Methanoperedens sp.]